MYSKSNTRPTDIILATMPKSGTTWLKALAFAITNRRSHSFTEHPLLMRNPHELVPFLEIPYHRDGNEDITTENFERLPSPRILATHMPISMLSAGAIDSGCKIVFLWRDPKDVLISWWHFEKKRNEGIMNIDRAIELFCEGVFPHGPFWDSVLEYWNESLKRPEKVLFLKYEEMMSETAESVIRLAEFLGFPFEEREMRDGVVEEIVRLCSFERLSGVEVNKRSEAVAGGVVVQQSDFFRNGKMGDWKNYLSDEMVEKLNGIVEQMLHGSGLVF